MNFKVTLLTKIDGKVDMFEGEVEAGNWNELLDAIPEEGLPEGLKADEPPEGLTEVSIKLELR